MSDDKKDKTKIDNNGIYGSFGDSSVYILPEDFKIKVDANFLPPSRMSAIYQEMMYGKFEPVPTVKPTCDCGAAKTYGEGLQPEYHSDWCSTRSKA